MTKLVRRQQTTIIKLGRTDDEVGAPATNRYLQNLEEWMAKLVHRQQTKLKRTDDEVGAPATNLYLQNLEGIDDEVGAPATNHYHKTGKD